MSQTTKQSVTALDYREIKTCDELLDEVKKYIKDQKELDLIKEAYEFSYQAHIEQKRKNGDPYIYHPLSAAYYLAQWKMGPSTIIAGLLHDVLEDTPVEKEIIIEKFGQEVANLVESVTKVSFFAKEQRQQLKSVYLRKLYLSMAKDIRVIIIKIADRLHNILTISNLREEKQKEIAKETLEIYSAIAHRLGMKNAKSLLEDRSFEILNPAEFKNIKKLFDNDILERQKTINKIINDLDEYLRKEKNIKIISIFGRPKTFYSIYRKMNIFGKNFEQITDLLAIRIITKSIDDCYKILGFIHQKYIPLAGKFKDYIATPKNNVYQSLHTTLSDSKGHIFEVQIRTQEMDEIAETGAAAHWRYKEGEIVDVVKRQKDIDEKLDIFSRILDFDNDGIEQHVQEDVFTSSIYVLTPNGAVITLPFGSTVLDFAYRIHTEIGEKTIGARIDGVFSPINTILKSGQVVEIKTSPKQEPTYEWLKIAATSNAKNRIKKFLNNKLNEESKDKKEQQLQLIKKAELNINAYINQKDWRWKKNSVEESTQIVKEMGYANLNEFLLDVVKGEYTTIEAAEKVYLKQDYSKDDEVFNSIKSKVIYDKNIKNDILVDGITNMKTTIASCCMPIPYEEVVGFVTKTNGIKVHLKECYSLDWSTIKSRLVSVQWNEAVVEQSTYTTKLRYFAVERTGLIYDISKILSGLKTSIINAKIITDEKTLSAQGEITVKVKDHNHLNQMILALKSIPGIREVERSISNKKIQKN
ncbi:RelA/SpoT family protein [Mycoplasma yeatsii]|uniref:Guanosine-3',5'-bis(Diphosphate) 3'-pyrophosphohydrolase n=1 Tax=Mycoplasma yeatsii TaxID=51365 RepID=A0ABU0NFB9_9MOLU|nr:RelA/SpoT family protein [Mycoplasma yeatsii]AJM71809.1 guanosine-3',5'-bis(diphosphate) 3'-pyrophosphohydrolase [Mycoplasma yeatsii GM274B]MDQ0567822.1 guanosine-3',5'-bis(diphosphate) 3'-pyrophosphohydrolase [Mycoplasma yeatsii]